MAISEATWGRWLRVIYLRAEVNGAAHVNAVPRRPFMHMKRLTHAISLIGLILLFPNASVAQTRYLRLEIMMDTDARRLAAQIPGQAAVHWETIASHPLLPDDRDRIALAALLYGRILFAHEETRVELFHRVGRAARRLVEGEPTFKVDTWNLQAGGMSFPIWPWRLVGPGELKSAKVYIATLIGSDTEEFFGILLDLAFGLERILAPASALVALSALSKDLDRDDRILLGQVLLVMNGYYGTPQTASRVGSEMAALRVALPLLLARSIPPEKRERIVNKQDTDRIFAINKAQWNAYAKQIGHPKDWEIRLNRLDTGTAVMAYDPKTGFGLCVQPLYRNDTDPPDMLIVASYYPAGTFRDFPEGLKREIEREARTDLGVGYDVSVSFQRFSLFGKAVDVVEITIIRASK